MRNAAHFLAVIAATAFAVQAAGQSTFTPSNRLSHGVSGQMAAGPDTPRTNGSGTRAENASKSGPRHVRPSTYAGGLGRPGRISVGAPSGRRSYTAPHFGFSPFNNTHMPDRDTPCQTHQSTYTLLKPRDDQWYVAWGNGFIIGGGGRSGARHRHGGCFMPAHYEYREYRVWIAGGWVEEYVPAVYREEWVGGRRVMVLVEPERVWRRYVPGHYETRTERVFVPARYVFSGGACTRQRRHPR